MSTASDLRTRIQEKTGYAFHDKDLLEAALTHSSIGVNLNNERLEFLGDRVLGLIISDMLYHDFPGESEGDLAKRLAALVSRNALAEAALHMSLADFIKVSPGENKAGGLKKDTILADALEALIAAIYLDGGLDRAREFIISFWEEKIRSNVLPPEDPKTMLQEWVQAKGLPLPAYKVVDQSGLDHEPVFEVEVNVEGKGTARARASNKRSAEKEAASIILKEIEKDQ